MLLLHRVSAARPVYRHPQPQHQLVLAVEEAGPLRENLVPRLLEHVLRHLLRRVPRDEAPRGRDMQQLEAGRRFGQLHVKRHGHRRALGVGRQGGLAVGQGQPPLELHGAVNVRLEQVDHEGHAEEEGGLARLAKGLAPAGGRGDAHERLKARPEDGGGRAGGVAPERGARQQGGHDRPALAVQRLHVRGPHHDVADEASVHAVEGQRAEEAGEGIAGLLRAEEDAALSLLVVEPPVHEPVAVLGDGQGVGLVGALEESLDGGEGQRLRVSMIVMSTELVLLASPPSFSP